MKRTQYCFPGRGVLLALFWFFAAPFSGLFAAVPVTGMSAADARSLILEAAGQYHGVPYRYGGIDRQGMDCSGFVYRSFDDALGIKPPRTVDGIYRWTEKIAVASCVPGDLVFFNTTGGVSHVGIYVGEGQFIHSASEGPKTGVIVSSLSESYWRRTCIGAGRALPPLQNGEQVSWIRPGLPQGGGGGSNVESGGAKSNAAKDSSGESRVSMTLALAPVLGSINGSGPFRGVSGLAGFEFSVRAFGRDINPSLEFRPAWDGTLGIFRSALTLSLALNKHFRIFAGPAFTMGAPSLRYDGEERSYRSNASWIGEVGITMTPFSLKTANGAFSLFGELTWQSYTPRAGNFKPGADLAAALRFATGIRYVRSLRER
ncbi:MAG: C40 family peptidase [Spirochaetaceae bacterium]|jgi:probable lipoprotein NlpC|nr:C40 family peptidase [Spirochaetaceae bacterium]